MNKTNEIASLFIFYDICAVGNMLKRTRIFGLEMINDADFDATVYSILNFKNEFDAAGDKLPLLFTPNVDDVVKLNNKMYAALAAILSKSYYILPDGQFIVLTSRLLRKPLKKRLAGSDLFPILWKELIANKKRVMVIAPNETVGELMKKEYAEMVYYVPPFFDEENTEELNNAIQACIPLFDEFKPEYVFLGIRFPKQNHIALGLIEHVKNTSSNGQMQMPLFLLLGASYEFYLNLKKRAPVIWRKLGLEWFHRVTQEPGRLFKRYFIEDLKFFPIVIKEFFTKN